MKFKKLVLTFLFSLCISSVCPITALASDSEAAVTEENPNARLDYIDWQYTTINGVLYRRIFNYSTNKPLSDWEIVP